MPIDDRTTNRNYKLPNPGNFLSDDVQRLRDALTAIDADVFARYTKTEVDTLISNLIAGAPGALDTLNELAASLGDDANFASTVTTALANRYTKTESDARYVQGVTQTENIFTGNGSQTAFTLTQAPPTRESLLVTVDGVVQPTTEYSLSGVTLTLSEAPASGARIRVLMLGVAGPVESASTLSFTQAGIGAVARTVDSKLKDMVSVKDFGAKGDQVTDDTAAIQAAVNAANGSTVYFPPGIYSISAPITLPSNSSLLGGTNALFPNFDTDWVGNPVPSWGFRAATIQYLNSNGAIFTGISYCTIDKLVFRNHRARNSSDFVSGSSSNHFKFLNCVVHNMQGLIPFDNGVAWGAGLIQGCQFTACTYVCQGSFLDSKILGNTFTSFTGFVFDIHSGGGLNCWANNRFEWGESSGIRLLANSRFNVITGNTFDAFSNVGIFFSQTTDANVVTGNLFWRNGRGTNADSSFDAHIKLFDSRNQLITGNTFRSGGPDGGGSWSGPNFCIGLESCTTGVNIFKNNETKQSCLNARPITDRLSDSSNCLDVDELWYGNDGGLDPQFSLTTLGRLMRSPTVVYIQESKTITTFQTGPNKLILRGSTSGITFTNSGGGFEFKFDTQIDNITYGGVTYTIRNGHQYASAQPDQWRSNGNWNVSRPIYNTSPTTYMGWIKTASGSPDTWKSFAAIV